MNDIQTLLNEYISDVNSHVDSFYSLNEAKLTNPDVKSLFKYLSAKRDNTDGLVTKVNKFTNAIVNSPTYQNIKSAISKQGANASKFVAEKTTEMFKALAELSKDKSYEVTAYSKQAIKDIYNEVRTSPELRPIVIALMMKAQEYIINKDTQKLDTLIDLTKYTIKQHREGTASTPRGVDTTSIDTSPEYNAFQRASKKPATYSMSDDEVSNVADVTDLAKGVKAKEDRFKIKDTSKLSDINKLARDTDAELKLTQYGYRTPKTHSLSDTEIDNLYDVSKLRSSNAGKIELANKGIAPQTVQAVDPSRIKSLALTKHTRGNLSKLNQVSRSSSRAASYINSFISKLESLPANEQNTYAKQWMSHLTTGIKSRLSESTSNDINILSEEDFFKNKLKRFGQRTGFIDKDPAEFDELMREWKSRGYPNEIDEITDILDSFGFSSREIKNAFKAVGIDNTESFSQLAYDVARVAQKNKLSHLVLSYLRKYFPKDSAKAALKENAVITHDFATEIFNAIVNRLRPAVVTAQKDSIMKDLVTMANRVRSMDNSTDQLMLIREMIVLMTEHSNDANLSKYKRIVSNLVSDVDLPEQTIIAIFRDLKGVTPSSGKMTTESIDLIETLLDITGHSWDDLSMQLTENNELLLTSRNKSANIIKTLENIQHINTYGRSRKCS